MPSKRERKLISKNRSAHHEYFIDETFLLLHRKEIDFLDGKLRNRGYALVPLELYFNTDGRVKLLLGLGRGKKLYDKREDMAKRDVQREIDRALKERNR